MHDLFMSNFFAQTARMRVFYDSNNLQYGGLVSVNRVDVTSNRIPAGKETLYEFLID